MFTAVTVVLLLQLQRSGGLTTVVLVAVVVTVQVFVTAFGRQDAATRPALEVAGGALCGNATKTTTTRKTSES